MRLTIPRARVARLAAGAAAVAFAAAALAATAPAQASTGCSVTYTAGEWWHGFSASITIQNSGSAINGWTLGFAFLDPGQKVDVGWSATYSQSGQNVTATNVDYNAAIATGDSVMIGFNGTWSGANPNPTSFTLNGVTCTTIKVSPSATPTRTPQA
ncbi:cellulose binding domain-containing protein, partial [Microbispora triticiradicis]|uniref:cellulose binding domain-containing protein n=1 Tax=Microbispora triticiradicis TaxID=2200763 RepID=UPI001AD67710